jgi:broad specificity phosphatase PhoE
MKKYLILVKHSLPEIEEDRAASEWKLSEEGRLQAHKLAGLLEAFHPEVIVSSPESKTKETSEIISKRLQMEILVVQDLHEHDRSNVPYLSQAMFQASMREFFQKSGDLVFGRETADQAHARFYQALHGILNEYKNKTLVLVTHGTVISLFVSRLTGSSDFELWKRMGLPSYIAIDLQSNTLIVKENID